MKRANKMDSPPKDLDKDVMKELECPVCFEYMKPPISMCQNGHSTCSDCRSKLNNCPSCRKPFLQLRNLALESLSTAFLAAAESCRKIYKCPFAKISSEDCTWVGALNGMKNHIKNKHTGGGNTHESDGQFNVILTNLSPGSHYRKAVWAEDELFYVIWEITDGSFYCAVLYVGPKKKSSKFKYKFSLTNENGTKNISMCFSTRSVTQDVEKILIPGECVVLHYETVLKFLNSDKFLSCDFEINPVETVSGVNLNKSANDNDCFTVKREFLGEQESPMKREFLGSQEWRGTYAGRRGRGVGNLRQGRAGRRGASDRFTEPHRRGLPGKQSKTGWSLSDLRDESHYQIGNKGIVVMGNSRDKVQVNVPKVSSISNSITLNPCQKVKISLAKSRDKVETNDPKVDSQKVKNSAMAKSRDKVETNDPKVGSQKVKNSAMAKSRDKIETNDPKVNPLSNSSSSIDVQSDKPTSLGNLHESYQAIYPKLQSFPSSSTVDSNQKLNNFESNFEKLKSSSNLSLVDSCQMIDLSPLDNLEINHPKLKSSPDLSIVRGVQSDQNKVLSPTSSFGSKGVGTQIPAEETWRCTLCGLLAPVKQTYFLFCDIAPSGTNWKCQLCGQWRA